MNGITNRGLWDSETPSLFLCFFFPVYLLFGGHYFPMQNLFSHAESTGCNHNQLIVRSILPIYGDRSIFGGRQRDGKSAIYCGFRWCTKSVLKTKLAQMRRFFSFLTFIELFFAVDSRCCSSLKAWISWFTSVKPSFIAVLFSSLYKHPFLPTKKKDSVNC